MDAGMLMTVYDYMRGMGLVGSKREFSRNWLGKGRTYLADFREDGRLHATVPGVIVDRLRSRLAAVAALVPVSAAHEIRAVVERIDKAVMVGRLLAR